MDSHPQSEVGAAKITVGVRVQPSPAGKAGGAGAGTGGLAGLGSTLDGASPTSNNDAAAAVAVFGQQIALSRKAPTADDDSAHVTEQLLFAYDHVFGDSSGSGAGDGDRDAAQQEVLEAVGYNALSSAWSGADATIFAYGQVCASTHASTVSFPLFPLRFTLDPSYCV